ncbi:MAG: hypothetical protein C0174_02000 [Thermodesulfobium narugense]|nr:MAG: hypothetical protein C0174_02000 [Thermodesulfobium narugense]
MELSILTFEKYLKKVCYLSLFSFILLIFNVNFAFAQNTNMPDKVTQIEVALYGSISSGSLTDRLSNLEYTIWGQRDYSDSLESRLNRIYDAVFESTDQRAGIALDMNALEYSYSKEVSSGPILDRISNLEKKIYGTSYDSYSLMDRLKRLNDTLLGGKVNQVNVSVDAGKLIRFRILKTISSKDSVAGDIVPLAVDEDVTEKGAIIIPKGSYGELRVVEAERAKHYLGGDGKLQIEFRFVTCADGINRPLIISKEAIEKNKSLPLTVGVSTAGLIILGPVGFITGFFVPGRDVEIQKNTLFYASLKNDSHIWGFLPGSKSINANQ